jgi:divalent metal cation (Fe/Co/Zn/Cd) transporter
VFIVATIAGSSAVVALEAVNRLIHPHHVHLVGWVIVAGLVGFVGNELVASFRIRVGRRIGSAALVADGLHARTDGFTSLAVVIGAVGVAQAHDLAEHAHHHLVHEVPLLAQATVHSSPSARDGIDPHSLTAHHFGGAPLAGPATT